MALKVKTIINVHLVNAIPWARLMDALIFLAFCNNLSIFGVFFVAGIRIKSFEFRSNCSVNKSNNQVKNLAFRRIMLEKSEVVIKRLHFCFPRIECHIL